MDSMVYKMQSKDSFATAENPVLFRRDLSLPEKPPFLFSETFLRRRISCFYFCGCFSTGETAFFSFRTFSLPEKAVAGKSRKQEKMNKF
jgi:hypothetical protein